MFTSPDVAVGIRSAAHVRKVRMDTLPEDAVIEVTVEEVKDDSLAVVPISSGITYTMSEALADQLDAVNAELEATEPEPQRGG